MQENDLALRFLFANHENTHVILRMPPATGIGSLKATLLQHWPTGSHTAACILIFNVFHRCA